MSEGDRPRGHPLLTVLALGMIGFILHALREVLLPLALAFFISYLGMPVLRLANRAGVPNMVGLVLVLLLFACILGGVGFVIADGIEQFRELDSRYEQALEQLVGKAEDALAWLGQKAEEAGAEEAADGDQPRFIDALAQQVSPGSVLSAFGTVANAVADLLLVLVFLVFILADRANRVLDRRMILAFSTPGTEDAQGVVEEIHRDIETYITLKTMVSLATGVLTAITLGLFEMPYAILFGFIAFILNYIVTVGSIAGAALPTMFAFLHFSEEPVCALFVGVVLGTLQVLVGNFLEPLIMGRRLGLNPITILLGLVIWGFLWGIWGMVLSVPLMVAFRLILEKTDSLPAVRTLMSSD